MKCTYKADDEQPNGICTFTAGSNGGSGIHAFKWFEIIICTWTCITNGNILDIWTVIAIIH